MTLRIFYISPMIYTHMHVFHTINQTNKQSIDIQTNKPFYGFLQLAYICLDADFPHAVPWGEGRTAASCDQQGTFSCVAKTPARPASRTVTPAGKTLGPSSQRPQGMHGVKQRSSTYILVSAFQVRVSNTKKQTNERYR